MSMSMYFEDYIKQIEALEEHIEFLENTLDEIAEKADYWPEDDEDQQVFDEIMDTAMLAIDPEWVTEEAHLQEALGIIIDIDLASMVAMTPEEAADSVMEQIKQSLKEWSESE